MENTKTISITDIVDLIIEKNIKVINDTIAEKNALIKELKNKYEDSINDKVEKLKVFFNEHFDERGLEHFMYVMSMSLHMGGMGSMFISDMPSNSFGGMYDDVPFGMQANSFGVSKPIIIKETREHKIFKEMFLCGLSLKGTDTEYDTIAILDKEIADLENQRYQIRNSKDKLIAEVTLQKLSSIDVNFAEKLDLLADRIFNKQEPKLID